MNKKIYDVLIVGAGAAGIACADELLRKNLDVLVVEAGSRVGGRARTLLRGDSQVPIELGAEFIHGAPTSTLKFLQTYNQSFYDVTDEHLFFQNGKLQPVPKFFERMDQIMQMLASAEKKEDHSVGQFIQAHKKLDAKSKKLFRAFVEGFHSADVNIMGQQGLADTKETDDDDLNGSEMFRPAAGYDALFQALGKPLEQNGKIQFNTQVKQIDWEKGQVKITCLTKLNTKPIVFHGKKLVLTVPLGVLKAEASTSSGILWNSLPKGLPAILQSLMMGHVQRLVFRFRTRFWEELSTKPVSFVHLGPENYFPTWWSLMPMRSNDLVAWQGGPKAQELSKLSQEEKIKTALQTLSKWSGKKMDFLMAQLQSCDTHDWSNDPYFLGAYSYVAVDGTTQAKKFARPIADTLYFAGEATCTGPTRGTISGAFDSGLRAAGQISKHHLSKNHGTVEKFNSPRLSPGH